MRDDIIEFTRKAAKSLTDYQKRQILRSEWFADCSDDYVPEELIYIEDASELIDRLQTVLTDNDFAEILTDYIISTISSNSSYDFGFSISALLKN